MAEDQRRLVALASLLADAGTRVQVLRGNQQCPWHCGCHNSFETFECFLVLPFSDSILKLPTHPPDVSTERWQSWVPARPARPAVRVLWVQNDAIARADRRVLSHETRGRGRGAFNHERRHNHQSGTTEEARISRWVVAEETDRDSTASSTAAVHRQLQTVG